MRRVMVEVDAADAERAGTLLSAVSGALVAIEEREGSGISTASVYLEDARAAESVRRLRRQLVLAAQTGLLRRARVRQRRLDELDWSSAWKAHYKPLRLAEKMYVVPSWNRSFRTPKGSDAVILDPGMAFGTGRHATTRLAAELLLKRLRPNDAVIDAGCGSGLLALAATVRGGRAFAFDEDPVAVRAARANFKASARRAAAIRHADRIPSSFPKAQIIVANITAETLIVLAGDFAARLARGGALISSGITARGRLGVLASFASSRLEFVREHRRGEWFAYEHVKP